MKKSIIEKINQLKSSITELALELSISAGIEDALLIEEIESSIELSDALKAYLSLVKIENFELSMCPGWLMLYSPSDLIEQQNGYRWVGGKEDEAWNSKWVVIGDWGGDPIIADISTEGTPVSLAVHGGREWKLNIVSTGIDNFLELLTAWINIALGKYSGQIRDNNSLVLKDFKNDLAHELSSTHNSEHVNNMINFID